MPRWKRQLPKRIAFHISSGCIINGLPYRPDDKQRVWWIKRGESGYPYDAIQWYVPEPRRVG